MAEEGYERDALELKAFLKNSSKYVFEKCSALCGGDSSRAKETVKRTLMEIAYYSKQYGIPQDAKPYIDDLCIACCDDDVYTKLQLSHISETTQSDCAESDNTRDIRYAQTGAQARDALSPAEWTHGTQDSFSADDETFSAVHAQKNTYETDRRAPERTHSAQSGNVKYGRRKTDQPYINAMAALGAMSVDEIVDEVLYSSQKDEHYGRIPKQDDVIPQSESSEPVYGVKRSPVYDNRVSYNQDSVQDNVQGEKSTVSRTPQTKQTQPAARTTPRNATEPPKVTRPAQKTPPSKASQSKTQRDSDFEAARRFEADSRASNRYAQRNTKNEHGDDNMELFDDSTPYSKKRHTKTDDIFASKRRMPSDDFSLFDDNETPNRAAPTDFADSDDFDGGPELLESSEIRRAKHRKKRRRSSSPLTVIMIFALSIIVIVLTYLLVSKLLGAVII